MQTIVLKDLEDGYCEPRELILHGAFQCLVEFLEGDAEKIDWKATEPHLKVWEEMTALYKWWVEERPKRHDPLDDIQEEDVPEMIFKPIEGSDDEVEFIGLDESHPGHDAFIAAGAESDRLETAWAEEDILNLHRLVEISPFLWY